MISDIVVDANVFAHVENSIEIRRKSARAFVAHLKDCSTLLCVDEGFSINESDNRSCIGAEYLKHLKPGMLGFAVVAYLARSRRVAMVSSKAPSVAKKIYMRVPNRTDCLYIRVAFNSQAKTFASHDFADISQRTRRWLMKEVGVSIFDASAALAALQ